MTRKIIKIFIAIALAVSIASPVFAIDWNEKQSKVTQGSSGSVDSICVQLFKGDPNNIFKEVFCSLINIAALSVADFSTDLACKIQQTSYASNYIKNVGFKLEDSGKCAVTGLSSISNNFRSDLTKNLSGPIKGNFETARGIMTVLALIFLFFLAFANILHININTYSVKRALPMIIVAFIGGYLAIYIVFILSILADFLFSLSSFSPQQALHPMFNIFGGYLGNPFLSDISASATTGPQNSVNLVFEVGKTLISSSEATFIGGIVGSIMLIIPAVVVFIFEYVLALRPFVIQILAILSPFAFASLILPQTQIIFRKWWTFLLIAIFYAPIVNFFFYLISLLPTDNSSEIVIITLWALKIVVIAFLIRLPFTLESDFRKIGVSLAQTGFGTSIGLDRIIKPKPSEIKISTKGFESDGKLKSPEAQRVIVTGRAPSAPVQTAREVRPAVAEPLITNIKEILREAHLANTKRTPDLLARSASDIPTSTFKAITRSSDLKIWRDRQIIEQLKNQKGQVLNEAGAALRADSARKLVRLAEVIDNGQLSNPAAIKFLSQKVALDELPLYILKKAFDDKIISTQDLQNTFGASTPNVINRLNQMSQVKTSQVNSQNISKIADIDQKDYATGYKDLYSAMISSLSDPKTAISGQNIIASMKKLDRNAIDQNGLFYLERLGQFSRQNIQQIAKTLQSEGIPTQTASAIAQNSNVNLSNINRFLDQVKLSDSSKQILERSFASRDLAGSLSREIASSVSAEKLLVQKGIAGKIAENISAGKDLSSIKVDVNESLQKLSNPSSPDDLQKNIDKINQYYPGAQIKMGEEITESDIAKTGQRGKSILETIESLSKGGIKEQDLKNNLPAIEKKIESQVNDTIRKVASGSISSDSAFEGKLSNISAPRPKTL